MIIRTPGQSSMLPGAVRASGELVYTSGVVAPAAMNGSVAFAEQAQGAMDALLGALADAGAGPDQAIKLEAFLADAADLSAWNEVFLRVWPVPGPARTTIVVGFAIPTILIELQAVAVID